jgi:hypothetical protein
MAVEEGEEQEVSAAFESNHGADGRHEASQPASNEPILVSEDSYDARKPEPWQTELGLHGKIDLPLSLLRVIYGTSFFGRYELDSSQEEDSSRRVICLHDP